MREEGEKSAKRIIWLVHYYGPTRSTYTDPHLIGVEAYERKEDADKVFADFSSPDVYAKRPFEVEVK